MTTCISTDTTSPTAVAADQVSFTQEDLKNAVMDFFEKNNLTFLLKLDDGTPYFTAFGVRMTELSQGWGVRLQAAPASCGTGLIFTADALLNYGDKWIVPSMLTVHSSTRGTQYKNSTTHWSTSALTAQFGERNYCDSEFLANVQAMFESEYAHKKRIAAARTATEEMCERLNANEKGLFSGTGYLGHVKQGVKGPEISLKIQTDNEDKVRQIVKIMEAL